MRLLSFLLATTTSMSAFSMDASDFVKRIEDKEADVAGYSLAMGYLGGVINATNTFGIMGMCPKVEGIKISEISRQIMGRVYLEPEEAGKADVIFVYLHYLTEEGLFGLRVDDTCPGY